MNSTITKQITDKLSRNKKQRSSRMGIESDSKMKSETKEERKRKNRNYCCESWDKNKKLSY